MNLLKKILLGAGIFTILGNTNIIGQENYNVKYKEAYENFVIAKDTNYLKAKTLDSLIDDSKTFIIKKNYSEQEAKEIISYLGKIIENAIISKKNDWNENFSYEEDSDHNFDYLKNLILLEIAKENHLPIYGMIYETPYILTENSKIRAIGYSPIELYLRWDPDGKHNILNQKSKKNKGDFNFKIGIMGFINFSTDEDLIKNNDLLTRKILKKKIYLTKIDKKEIKAIAYYKKTQKLYGRKKYDEMLKIINKAIKLSPKTPFLYSMKGFIFEIEKEFKKSLKNQNKAIKLNPRVGNYFNKGNILKRMKKEKRAKRNYKKANKLLRNQKNISNQK